MKQNTVAIFFISKQHFLKTCLKIIKGKKKHFTTPAHNTHVVLHFTLHAENIFCTFGDSTKLSQFSASYIECAI